MKIYVRYDWKRRRVFLSFKETGQTVSYSVRSPRQTSKLLDTIRFLKDCGHTFYISRSFQRQGLLREIKQVIHDE